jgi:AraC-like DNA-binding protein
MEKKMGKISANDFIGTDSEPDMNVLASTLGPASRKDLVHINVYFTPELSVFLPNGMCFYAEPEHTHPGYSFVIPISKTVPFIVDGKIKTAEKGKIFPVNPGQSHRGDEDFMLLEYIAFCVDRDFLQTACCETGSRLEMIFKNQSYSAGGLLENLINNYIFELKNKREGFALVLQGLAIQVAVCLLRAVRCGGQPAADVRCCSDRRNILQAAEYIYANFDRDLSLNEIAEKACLSPYHFIRAFKKETGRTPFEYLLEVKMEKAKEFLRIRDKPVSEICYDCGFSSPSHFTDIFTKKVGMPPSRYRAQVLSPISLPRAKK